VLKTK